MMNKLVKVWVKPHLKAITIDLGVLSDSLNTPNGNELKAEDLKDIDIAINNMSKGILFFIYSELKS